MKELTPQINALEHFCNRPFFKRIRSGINNVSSVYVGHPIESANSEKGIHELLIADIKNAIDKLPDGSGFTIFTPQTSFHKSTNFVTGSRTIMYTNTMALMSSAGAIFYYDASVSSMGVPLEIFLACLHEIPTLIFVDTKSNDIPSYLHAVASYSPSCEVHRCTDKANAARIEIITPFLARLMGMKAMSAPRGVQ